jgi:acyl carrier protein/aryl carrier-like protein
MQAVKSNVRTVGISVAEQNAQGAAHAWAKVLSLEMPQSNVKYTEGTQYMIPFSDVWGTRQHGAAGTIQRPILLKRPRAAQPITSHTVLQSPAYPIRAAITGGLGALGTLVAKSLVLSTSAPSELLLLGRSAGLSTAAGFAAAPTSNVMVTIMKLDGAFSSDIATLCDADTLHLIHHASGVVKDAAIRAQTLGNVRSSAASKTVPARLLLTEAAKTMPISHHIMYGSIAASLGSAGQLPYAMANSDLEGIVSKSAAQGIQSINIAWGAWGSVGMATNAGVESKLKAVGISVLQPEIGLSIIHGLLKNNGSLPNLNENSSLIAAVIQWSKLLLGGNRSKMPFYQDMVVVVGAQQGANQTSLVSNIAESRQQLKQQQETVAAVVNLEGLVMDAITKVLGSKIGLDEPLLAAGLDSIGSGEVHALLEKSSRVSLPSTLVFDYPTAASIIQLLKEKIPAPVPMAVAAPTMALPALKPVPSLSEITATVSNCTAKILGAEPAIDVLLMSAGLDSLGVPQLQKELAAAFDDIDIPASLAIDYPTIESMAAYISHELEQRTVVLKQAAAVAATVAAEQARIENMEENTNNNNSDNILSSRMLLLPSATGVISPLAPKLSKAGYFAVPSILRLQRMSEEELKQVSRFVIGRQGYGEIAFLYPVDLRNANLDEIVQIGKGSITLYGGNKTKTPLPGEGLNQPALLTFKRIFPRTKSSKGSIMAFKGVLLQACSRMGATFVHWDPDEGVWIAKTDQF